MSNTLTSLTNTLLAWDAGVIQAELNKVLNPVIAKVTPFDAFATRFDSVPSGNGTINVPIPTYPTGSSKSGISIITASVTNAPVTLTNDYTVFYAFNPVEVQTSGLTNLVNTFIAPAIYGIEAQLQADAFALLASFPTSSVKPTTTAYFSSSAITAINADFSNSGINGDRVLVTNAACYWALIDNLSSKGNAAGAAAIQSGSPNNPFNMAIAEGQLLPSANNLVAFGGTKGGIIVATAIPPVIHPNGQSITITSPRSGLNVLVEQYYDESNRRWVIGASVVGNVVTGNTGALKRIVSA
jgi:hypothetical protein